MNPDLEAMMCAQAGVATTAQILDVVTRRTMRTLVDNGAVERMWQGIYCLGEPTERLRLSGLDLMCGATVPICLATAARWHGFDTETVSDLHVLNPDGHQLRSADGLVVHRRDGAPLVAVRGRLATTPAWTAVEVARGLRRGRALATLDAALRCRVDRADLWRAAQAQAGRRGIVAVRDLLPLANALAESPMESEARLVMIDGGLPMPELQYGVRDASGRRRRVDFAWPWLKVAAEYDSRDWHEGEDLLRRDRVRYNAFQDIDWVMIPIVFDDVRKRPDELVARIDRQLRRRQAA